MFFKKHTGVFKIRPYGCFFSKRKFEKNQKTRYPETVNIDFLSQKRTFTLQSAFPIAYKTPALAKWPKERKLFLIRAKHNNNKDDLAKMTANGRRRHPPLIYEKELNGLY